VLSGSVKVVVMSVRTAQALRCSVVVSRRSAAAVTVGFGVVPGAADAGVETPSPARRAAPARTAVPRARRLDATDMKAPSAMVGG
jgi:hypothetical protein